MGLSDSNNSHGEFPDAQNYNYVLCCDFPTSLGSTTCTGTNKIIGLSAATNAHAEIPENTNYTTDVCYESMQCRSTTAGCYANETGILSLSSATNAHIGSSGYYSTEICCNPCLGNQDYIGGVCVAKSIPYWADTNKNFISSVSVVPGFTQVMLVIDGTHESQGTTITFEIYERDTLFDDNIRTTSQGNALTATVDESGNASVIWTITQTDINNANGGGSETEYDFYFIASSSTLNTSEVSGDLNATLSSLDCDEINLCSNYQNQGDCAADSCGVASNSVGGVDCSDPLINCICSWDSGNSSCDSSWTVSSGSGYCGNGVVEPGEQCDGSDWGTITDCSDFGFSAGSLSCDSNTCMFDVSFCTGFPSGGSCGDGVINLGEQCDKNISSGFTNISSSLDCSSFDTFDTGSLDCVGCNVDTSGCSDSSSTSGGVPSKIGICTYKENSATDDCADGFLTYSWDAIWAWDPLNINTSAVSGPDWIEDPARSGNWHYDPQRKSAECINGENVISCPAKIELPFFGLNNALAIIILIIFIYIIYTKIFLKKKKSKVTKKSINKKKKKHLKKRKNK